MSGKCSASNEPPTVKLVFKIGDILLIKYIVSARAIKLCTGSSSIFVVQ